MTPHWQRLGELPPASSPLFMNAVLTPHRSLSRKAFFFVLIGFACVDAAVVTIFLLQGAYPVAFFLILDVFLLWLAFRVNYRDARAEERVQVGADRLIVTRTTPKGRAAYWSVSPVWARVRTDGRSVRIASAGKSLAVGAFLSPPERGSFARALNAALYRARREGFRGDS
ncbi:MAG: DUF2244 domain-containing protein [Hyphomonadaceae bacterium]